MQDATSLAAAIASGAVPAAEAMAASVAAADRFGAVVRVETAAGPIGDGPFAGVPFLGKDLGSGAAGLSPVAGSAALARRRVDQKTDSDLFARFRRAGLVPFGLTRVPEFGLALTSDPCVNPWDAGLSPGGSSGGAAAAVAGGIVAMAHATDAAGSIRVPAACCGLVGLKPSRGAVPMGPDQGNWLLGLASELVLARSVRDVAMAFAAVAEPWAGGRPFGKGPVAMVLPDGCAAAQVAGVEAVAEVLRGFGLTVERRDFPVAMAARAGRVAQGVLTASLAEWMGFLGVKGEELTPIAAAVMAEGCAMTGAEVFALGREMAILTAEWEAWMGEVDAVISPVLRDGVPKVGAFDMGARDVAAHFAQISDIAPGAALANAAGFPAVVVPVAGAGIPVGVQIAARAGCDRALLALAARVAGGLPEVAYPYPVAGHP
ncbi:amidase family protein [Fuscovulum ytuae]|uniref:Amidase family protein n=1 Tax=Fuscovulum ytuae TaxID=3042299 RepID=A0ABY8Q8Q0_9RHOB|nr:amidase family protein [Fuscovulum sp. YMD61]WGV17214.1 amidase family protein [Fuscovulum sp. YMD61]